MCASCAERIVVVSPSSREAVASAKPEFAIISVGSGNFRACPATKFSTRLAAAGTRVYRTDLDGAVTFTSTATPSHLRWRLSNDLDLRRRVVVLDRPTIIRDQLLRFLRILFPHEDDHSPQSWERILQQRRRSEVTVNARGVEQTLDDQSLRLLLGIEHLHQFLIGIRSRLRAGRQVDVLWHAISNLDSDDENAGIHSVQ